MAGLARALAAAAAAQPGIMVWLCPPEWQAWPGRSADGLEWPAWAREPGAGSTGPDALARELGLLAVQAEVLHGSADVPGGQLLRLVDVMDTLRTECPWDAKQTHETLAPYLLEECYEALDALESGKPARVRARNSAMCCSR